MTYLCIIQPGDRDAEMAMDFTHVSSSLALHSLNHRHFQSKLVQHELLVLETFFPGRWPLRILFLQHRQGTTSDCDFVPLEQCFKRTFQKKNECLPKKSSFEPG